MAVYVFKNYGGGRNDSDSSDYNRGASSASSSTPVEQTVTAKNRQYSALDWMRKQYRRNFKNYYAPDDEDQANRANGLMPRSFRNSYADTEEDMQLRQLGIPSADHFDDYFAEYLDWLGNGTHYTFDEEPSAYIKAQWQKLWTYDPTPEDLQRKANDRMPKKVESQFFSAKEGVEDLSGSYADEYSLSQSLPPTAELDAYLGMCSTILQKTRVNEFYGAVVQESLALAERGVKNGDTLSVREDVMQVTGASVWQDKYFEVLGRDEWADARDLVVTPDSAPDVKSIRYDPSWTAAERTEAEMYVRITDEESLTSYISTRGVDDPVQILQDFGGGVAKRQLRQAKNLLLNSGAQDDAKRNAIRDAYSRIVQERKDAATTETLALAERTVAARDAYDQVGGTAIDRSGALDDGFGTRMPEDFEAAKSIDRQTGACLTAEKAGFSKI